MSGFIQNRRAIDNGALNSVLDFLSGDRLVSMTSALSRNVLIPTAAIMIFLVLWSAGARQGRGL